MDGFRNQLVDDRIHGTDMLSHMGNDVCGGLFIAWSYFLVRWSWLISLDPTAAFRCFKAHILESIMVAGG